MKVIEKEKRLKCGFTMYKITAYIVDNKKIIFRKENGDWVDSKEKEWKFIDSSISDEEIIKSLNKEKMARAVYSKLRKEEDRINDRIGFIKNSIEELDKSSLLEDLFNTKIESWDPERGKYRANPFYEKERSFWFLIRAIESTTDELSTSTSIFVNSDVKKFIRSTKRKVNTLKNALSAAIISFARLNKGIIVSYDSCSDSENKEIQFSDRLIQWMSVRETKKEKND